MLFFGVGVVDDSPAERELHPAVNRVRKMGLWNSVQGSYFERSKIPKRAIGEFFYMGSRDIHHHHQFSFDPGLPR